MAVRLSALRASSPLPPGRFLVLISVRGWVDLRAITWLEGLGKLKKIHLIGTRTRNLPACSIVPQPTTLPRASLIRTAHNLGLWWNRSRNFDRFTPSELPWEQRIGFCNSICTLWRIWLSIKSYYLPWAILHSEAAGKEINHNLSRGMPLIKQNTSLIQQWITRFLLFLLHNLLPCRINLFRL
jgi:hypothetical protein